ncbi:MAG TPA: hypothetical protein ENJ95_22185 [Bacteroidetes bacterium]|nr:hypothetical protein [Bacteroidota bacterium]
MAFYKYVLFVFLFSLPYYFNAQVQDDFSDGNLTTDPSWQGDAADFVVNDELQLQLNAPGAGTSNLFLQTNIADSAMWELYFKMDFSPSGSNSLRIVLQNDQAGLDAGNGYFLFLGETGSSDALRFFRMDDGAETLLASATVGAVADAPEVRLKMMRKTGGNWTLLVDYSGGQNFEEEFQIEDATYGGGDLFFGFQCKYTSTRTDKFFFDDIKTGPLLPDISPPVLLSATAISPDEVDVFFDEKLEETAATEPSNFSINNGIGQPAAAFLDATDQTIVHLSLQNPLANMTDYILQANNIADVEGNIAAAQNAAFTFVQTETAAEFDLLINEIMADPTPPVAIPPVEFIEIFNRSDKVLDLEGFGFSSGSTPVAFPAFQILPKKYALVCDENDVDSLTLFGEVIGLPGFPSLVNSGDELTLTDAEGNIVHRTAYSTSTYGDPQKDDGGWTLELINPQAPCKGESNWSASVSLLGGTPGQPNSILDESPDVDGPNLLRAFATPSQPSRIGLFFDESLDKISATDVANYSVSNGIQIMSAVISPSANDAVRLDLVAPLQPSVVYEIRVGDQLKDCSGNPISENKTTLALPEAIGPDDLVINEILFNPEPGGVDFVEVFNRSEKVLNLGDLIIGNVREGIDTTVRQVRFDRLIFPGEYAVFTEAPADILGRYHVENESALISNDLPAFNNDAGNVALFRTAPTGVVIIDAFDYEEGFHHPLLDKTDGVSLERLNPEAPTQDRNNWHSAAATVGFATPTSKNSQAIADPTSAVDFFDIPEKKLSPDGDGFQDFLLVNYKTDRPGYTAQAKIFDAEGRPVKTIFNNELLATEGFFRWDGDTDRGDKARIGIYILWVQLFHADGGVKEFKETCVVAGRL